ncbi:AMP-binding protein [Mycobacterium shigaense]|uniref:AMP-binding protein n=1 Tax=Mycobacterium shigaense TaxID=722731 RepID=UPI000E57B1DF|nr:AMP-binding protein [Mycobacterium shigaense]MEA1123094.1 AMP-binding protein [Mycobacterium shigaense]
MNRVDLSKSQQNIYNGVMQDSDPALYLIGKSYRFRRQELSSFLTALNGAIFENPVQLCVLEARESSAEAGYPELVARLRPEDIVRVRHESRHRPDDAIESTWSTGILAKPLVRHTVRTDDDGYVSGLDVHTHHILLDGGATAMIEADLARHLSTDAPAEIPSITEGMLKLAQAHRREASRVEESRQRLADAVQRELADQARQSVQGSNDAPRAAAKGVLQESTRISGGAYDAIVALSESQRVPLNVLVAAAAVAVDASLRQSTEGLLVYPVDNRFGDPDLSVATCLVNSVAHAIRFAPFASVRDVVRDLDRSYVKAVRRRWLREEHFRRMYMAVNRTSHVQTLTLNFLREPCAPGLRPFLSEAPIATDVGPVDGMTVACLQDEEQRTLSVAIWNRADLPAKTAGITRRIATALESMAALWDNPIAMAVEEWMCIGADGALCRDNNPLETTHPAASAWFLDPAGGVRRTLQKRPRVYSWIALLVRSGARPGDVLVIADDDTDNTVDFLIACHLTGCGYSVCDTADEIGPRAEAIAAHRDGGFARVIDVAATRPALVADEDQQLLADQRIAQVARDPLLAGNTAYIMPTSGSTGQPKLVQVSHGSLAAFCQAVVRVYGWKGHDTVLQCAPLTSDISVEEIFGAATCGAALVRSTAMRVGDLTALARDLVANTPTIVDLPTAVWHLLCEDAHAIDAIRRSKLRQVIVGGEAIRTSAVDAWIDSGVSQRVSLISTYGPTETTVVVSYLPICHGGAALEGSARRRLGAPMLPGTVFVAFGEVVIVGDLVCGYLGSQSGGFGTVTLADGSQRHAFATADRVIDDDGFPVFAGRKDAIVKVSGKRIDIAEVTRRILGDPAVFDVAVELHDGRLGVWFESQLTRAGSDDPPLASRIRSILVSVGVSSFFVIGLTSIPRKPNAKIDSDKLRAQPEFADTEQIGAGARERAAGLTKIWSRHLGRVVRPDASLLEEGIGSLDLIRILPDTRSYLGRHLTLLDLISADSAEQLAASAATSDAWMDSGTADEIGRTLAALRPHVPAPRRASKSTGRKAIVVLGASGILGTGFGQAVLDLRRSGAFRREVVLVTRSPLPETDPWTSLRDVEGVRIEHVAPEFGTTDVDGLLRSVGAETVINCIGNTNVLVPYGQLQLANVEFVSMIAQTCASLGAKLVHLSTFVVNAEVNAARVIDPRAAPYPYAASKSLAELVVAATGDLDFAIARLPRVLGRADQIHDSADILVSLVDACTALHAYPTVTLTEEVTTGLAAANAVLGLLAESAGGAELGREITAVRGAVVPYAEFLSEFAAEDLDPFEWKYRLDQSDWAKNNPRRWSVVDGWITLGMRLGGRPYAEYLANYPSIAVDAVSVADLDANPYPLSVRALLAQCVAVRDLSAPAT